MGACPRGEACFSAHESAQKLGALLALCWAQSKVIIRETKWLIGTGDEQANEEQRVAA